MASLDHSTNEMDSLECGDDNVLKKGVGAVDASTVSHLKIDSFCFLCGAVDCSSGCKPLEGGFLTFFNFTESNHLECKACKLLFSRFFLLLFVWGY